MPCEQGRTRDYCTIVMVAAILLAILGAADIIRATTIMHACSYDAQFIPLMLVSLGVVTIATGLLICYVLGRELEFSIFFTNIYWQSYKIASWVMTIITYIVGVLLVCSLKEEADRVGDHGCSEISGFIDFHIFAFIAVPIAPILCVAFILALFIIAGVLYVACRCIECLNDS